MNEGLDAQIGRVQLVSRWMHWIFKIASGLIAVAFLYVWINAMARVDASSPTHLVLIGTVMAFLGYYGWRISWHIAGLFRCFQERRIYTSESIREIYSIGRSLFFLGVFEIVSTFVGVFLGTLGSVEINVTNFIGGVFVMLLAWIFGIGRKLQVAEAQGA